MSDLNEAIKKLMHERGSWRDAIIVTFLRETGLKGDQIVLCEQIDGNFVRFWVEAKVPREAK